MWPSSRPWGWPEGFQPRGLSSQMGLAMAEPHGVSSGSAFPGSVATGRPAASVLSLIHKRQKCPSCSRVRERGSATLEWSLVHSELPCAVQNVSGAPERTAGGGREARGRLSPSSEWRRSALLKWRCESFPGCGPVPLPRTASHVASVSPCPPARGGACSQEAMPGWRGSPRAVPIRPVALPPGP